MKVIITESQYNRAIDKFISFSLEPFKVKIIEKYPDSIYWVKDGEIIAEIRKSKYFWLRYDIWNDISRMFELNYNKTKYVISIWLEQHHNLKELDPDQMSEILSNLLNQYATLKELNPQPPK